MEIEENEISYKIRGAIFNVYNNLGPGLLKPETADRPLKLETRCKAALKLETRFLKLETRFLKLET